MRFKARAAISSAVVLGFEMTTFTSFTKGSGEVEVDLSTASFTTWVGAGADSLWLGVNVGVSIATPDAGPFSVTVVVAAFRF